MGTRCSESCTGQENSPAFHQPANASPDGKQGVLRVSFLNKGAETHRCIRKWIPF